MVLCIKNVDMQYFKKQEKTSSPSGDNLPNPTGPLSKKIPSKAIVTVNQKVMEVLEKQGEKCVSPEVNSWECGSGTNPGKH